MPEPADKFAGRGSHREPAWVTEDDAEAERVAIEMMEAAMPVSYQEED